MERRVGRPSGERREVLDRAIQSLPRYAVEREVPGMGTMPLMPVNEVARLLNISVQSLDRRLNQLRVPCIFLDQDRWVPAKLFAETYAGHRLLERLEPGADSADVQLSILEFQKQLISMPEHLQLQHLEVLRRLLDRYLI